MHVETPFNNCSIAGIDTEGEGGGGWHSQCTYFLTVVVPKIAFDLNTRFGGGGGGGGGI